MDLTNRDAAGPEPESDLKDATREFGIQFPHCPNPALLQAAQSGVLPEEAGAAVKEHASTCSACSSLVRDLAELDEAPLEAMERERIWGMIRAGIAAEESSTKVAQRHSWWKFLFRPAPIAIAAAAVVLVAIAGRLMQDRQQPTVAVSQAVRPPAVAPPPASVLRADKPPIMLPASAVLVWRGESGTGNAQGKELREALVPYEADQYPEAAQRLERLVKKYPRLAEAQFYLGVCRLFMDRNADAAASLKTARSLAGPALRDHAAWYLALAYHKSGRDGDARPLLEHLCRAAGTNSEKACSGLKDLQVVQ